MISIGLPAVKPTYLAEAVESVLAQTWSDFELIIHNDRRDVAVRKIAALFKDPRIRYIEGEGPLDVVENWNRTLSYARGEYFILFSDDDRYDPGFLAGMKQLAERYPGADVFHCRVRKIDVSGQPGETTVQCPEYEPGIRFILHRLEGTREHFAPEFMVRADALKAIGGFVDLPLAWGADDLTWFRLALRGGIACHPEPLTDWRQSPLQISRSGDPAGRLMAIDRYAGLLRELLASEAALEADAQDVDRALLLIDRHAGRQKAHLVAVAASNQSFLRQLSFYFSQRKRHKLKFAWLIYSLYAKSWKPSRPSGKS